MIRIINQILRQRIRILIKIINHKARKEIKILARRENVPNAANREAIPLRNVHLKNHLRKPKKRTWLQLAIMDLQEGQFRKFRDHDILKTVITKIEDCLYLREENRIKAMDVSGKDYAFYANYSRRAQASELREGFTQVIGRVKDTESDTDSVASGHVSAYFAAARGKVRDEDDDDDDGSVVTDDTSDQESTVHDDQLRPRSAAKDVSRLTTYRGE